MLLRLIRKNDNVNDNDNLNDNLNDKSVCGELWVIDPIFGDKKVCDTIENRDYLIPELIYPVHVTHSPKFRRLLPLIYYVPGRTGIRIHAGNEARHSEGCVLVGHHPYLPTDEEDESEPIVDTQRLVDSRQVERMVTQLLLSIDSSREDIRIDVTHEVPEAPGYPEYDYGHGYASPVALAVVNHNDNDN